MKYTEAKLEQTFIELLSQDGFPHHIGISLKRMPDEVLIEDDIRAFLLSQYKNEGITDTEIKTIILQLKSLPSSDLY